MIPSDVAFDRFLREKHARREKRYSHISSRIAVEDLPPEHLYHWIAKWANHQLADIGVNSTAGVVLPPLHFELIEVNNDSAGAHTFEADEWGFIVMTKPMLDEMLRLSRLLVDQNPVFMTQQIAPAASAQEISELLLLMQFCFVMSHEYSHLVRQHLNDRPPYADALGVSLRQAQELDADGYGIYHNLAFFFNGRGRALASQLLKISSPKHLENSILSCFLLAAMLQFCARWAGKMRVEADLRAEHPPHPVRIEYTILFIEMWCREIGAMSTTWMTDGAIKDYFSAAARLFPPKLKATWDKQVSLLKSPRSEQYLTEIRRSVHRLRTGEDGTPPP